MKGALFQVKSLRQILQIHPLIPTYGSGEIITLTEVPGGHRRTATAQHGARQLFGSMPKATQLSEFGPAAMRRQPGEGGEQPMTAGGGNLTGCEVT